MALRILIADHRNEQIMPLVEFLLGRGQHTVICKTGGDAVDAIGIQLADETPFDLVIAHIDLPEIPGLRVLYEARRLHLPTVAAVICPRHLRDEKVERMIRKVGIAEVMEQHIDLAQVDRLLKQVIATRKAEAAKAKERAAARQKAKAAAQATADAAAQARAEAEQRQATRKPAGVEAFKRDLSGASAMFFRSDDQQEEDSLPPIGGGGPPSAPTGIHQIMPPSADSLPPPSTMTPILPPTQRATPGQRPPTPPPADEPERQRRMMGSGAQRVPTTGSGKQALVSAKCFRCGQLIKVKATGKVVSQPCLGCGTINDIRT